MKLGLNGKFLRPRVTGVQRFATEIAARLVERTPMTLFVPRGARPGPRLAGAEVVTGALPGPLWEQIELAAAARRARVDVLLHPANALPVWGGPHVVVLHDVTPLTRPSDFTPAYRVWFRLACASPARRAAAVLTVSRHAAGEISRVLHIPRERISVVRQGVAPFHEPAADAEVAQVRRRYGLPERYFLAVGRGDPRKGLEFLSGAHARWREEHPEGAEVPLVVVGRRTSHVHRATVESGPFQALGRVSDDELRALYTGAVAFLYPSSDEGFGRLPLEALASGTRVLVAPYPTAEEVLGEAADIVPRTQEAWARALSQVLAESPAGREASIERGRAWAASFSWDGAVERILAVCRDVAEAGRAARLTTEGPARRARGSH